MAGAGLGATTALTITAETAGQLTAPGGLATFAGNEQAVSHWKAAGTIHPAAILVHEIG